MANQDDDDDDEDLEVNTDQTEPNRTEPNRTEPASGSGGPPHYLSVPLPRNFLSI